MAFLAKVEQTSVSPDGLTTYVKDVTGFIGDTSYVLSSENVYEEKINDTGYGPDNDIELTDYARILVGRYKATAGDEIVLPDIYVPIDAALTEFSFPTKIYGMYTFQMYLIKIDSGQALSEGDVVFVYDAGEDSPYSGRIEELKSGVRVAVDVKDLDNYVLFKSDPYYHPHISLAVIKEKEIYANWLGAEMGYNNCDVEEEKEKEELLRVLNFNFAEGAVRNTPASAQIIAEAMNTSVLNKL